MHLRQIERAVEMRTLAGRMPRGARCKLALLDEDNVGPSLERKVVEQPHAHDPAADDYNACMRFQSALLGIVDRELS
jgi:hypothetical protein